MKYLIWLLFIVVSCKQKEKENQIVGKWEYERMETYSGEPINLADSLINNLHQQQKGLTFSFTSKNVFKVSNPKAKNPQDFIAEQPYELSTDKKSLVLKNKGRPDDNFSIIELSDSLLKINIFYSDTAYMVFGKKE
ncbi:MAG: hypothetical protein H7Y01_11665 [Ferruginibacter sp.]|nr:hypothetical protein [Chitinophagaceae bacterium]